MYLSLTCFPLRNHGLAVTFRDLGIPSYGVRVALLLSTQYRLRNPLQILIPIIVRVICIPMIIQVISEVSISQVSHLTSGAPVRMGRRRCATGAVFTGRPCGTNGTTWSPVSRGIPQDGRGAPRARTGGRTRGERGLVSATEGSPGK